MSRKYCSVEPMEKTMICQKNKLSKLKQQLSRGKLMASFQEI